jgi:hypothetical protein
MQSRVPALKTLWEVRSYDVRGNAASGYEVNETFVDGTVEIAIRGIRYNMGTPEEFISYYPSNRQIRDALGISPRVKITANGDDTHIYVEYAKDGCPAGELICTSHESLSPVGERLGE